MGVLAVVLLTVPAAASAAVQVANGGFETGTFSGWTEQDEPGSAGSWFVYSGTTTPLSNQTVPAPPQGTYAAITDQEDPAANYLYQDLHLPSGHKYLLSLYVYYTSEAPIANPPSLDYDYTGPNQQYRVDVIKPTAMNDSVSSSDILKPVFATGATSPETMAPTLMSADLSAFAGQTVRLRAAQADNESFMHAGLDGVSITTSPNATTGAATRLGAHRATLHGAVNPNSASTTYHLEYGKTKKYGARTATHSAGAGSTTETEAASLRGLKPGTTYHFRIVATNAAGTTFGRDRTFSTPASIAVSGIGTAKCTAPTTRLRVTVTSGDRTKNTSVFIGRSRVASVASSRVSVGLSGVAPGGHSLTVRTRSAAGRTTAVRHFSVCAAAAFTG
jgi:hypothetical protein